MSRIKRLVRPQSEPHIWKLSWKLALPVLGLALSAAVYSQVGTAAPAAPQQDAPAAHRESKPAHRVREDAYALVGDDERGMNISGDGGDWTAIKQIRRSVDGEFLWFRDGGKSYIVQDREVLAKAHAAYEPLERLGKQMDVHGKDMDRHGKAMDALGKEMSQAAAGIRPDEVRIHALERKMNELGREMGRVGEQMGQASEGERKPLEDRMARLSAQMNDLGGQMREASESARQRAAQQAMNDVGRRMDEAGKPMDALGKQMGELGKQMEQEGYKADKTVRALIRDAMARGLARPAPQG